MYRIRKFIILVAVMAISVVYAVTPVDFSNIVGYQVTTVTNGYSFKTPTFVDVGTNVLNIQNFRLSDRASGDSTETIQVLDDKGALSGIYTWLNETVGMEPGWYDYWTWERVSTDIPASLGYFMHANSKVKVKVIGELKLDSTTVELPIGYSVFGNNTPRDINLQDIRLGGDDACDKTENNWVPITPAPEPTSGLLILIGAAGLALRRKNSGVYRKIKEDSDKSVSRR